jgi:hypothetical protein
MFYCVDIPQFIHLLIKDHLGFFQILVIMNKVPVDTGAQFLCGHEFSSQLSKYQGVCLLGRMVTTVPAL